MLCQKKNKKKSVNVNDVCRLRCCTRTRTQTKRTRISRATITPYSRIDYIAKSFVRSVDAALRSSNQVLPLHLLPLYLLSFYIFTLKEVFGWLVLLGWTCHHAYTCSLSMSSSMTTLKWNSYLVASFALRCFQRLSVPDLVTRRCSWRNSRYASGQSNTVLSY